MWKILASKIKLECFGIMKCLSSIPLILSRKKTDIHHPANIVLRDKLL